MSHVPEPHGKDNVSCNGIDSVVVVDTMIVVVTITP